jgi:hypothetical protein
MLPALRTAILAAIASSAFAQSAAPPQTFTPEGGTPLPLAGQATREVLLGRLALYNIALYAEGPAVDQARLGADDAAKALRFEVRYEDDLRRRVVIDWRGELVPSLETPATTHLRATFGSLRLGDVLIVEYVPGKGTTVRINKMIAAAGANHDLMLAFLDHWLGQQPVSEDIKGQLLRAP